MSQNDDLMLTIIGAALIASGAVEIRGYDRELLNRIVEAEQDVARLLQLPVFSELRTLAHAIHTVLCAPAGTTPVTAGAPRVDRQRCEHPSCACAVDMSAPHWPFCSEHCKEAADTTELRCDCQHPACRQLQASLP